MSETSESSVRITSPQGVRYEHATPVWQKKNTLVTRAKTAARIAAGAATLGGLITTASLVENASAFRPSANEYYSGDAIINLDKAIAKPSAGQNEQATIDEHTLTVNGQSLQGVERIKVSNPELVEFRTIVADRNNRNIMVNQLMIKVPFDNGIEVYYVYGGPDGIKLVNGEIIKGQETQDGGFMRADGIVVPPDEISVVKAISNKP